MKEAVRRIPGSYFSVEGDQKAVSVARDIIAALQGKEIALEEWKKTLYHAGACAASNFLVAAVGFGMELFEAAGINRKYSLKALMPLIKGTVKNIDKLGIPSALTGPIARGDANNRKESSESAFKVQERLDGPVCRTWKIYGKNR